MFETCLVTKSPSVDGYCLQRESICVLVLCCNLHSPNYRHVFKETGGEPNISRAQGHYTTRQVLDVTIPLWRLALLSDHSHSSLRVWNLYPGNQGDPGKQKEVPSQFCDAIIGKRC